jgi:hypothetical protein
LLPARSFLRSGRVEKASNLQSFLVRSLASLNRFLSCDILFFGGIHVHSPIVGSGCPILPAPFDELDGARLQQDSRRKQDERQDTHGAFRQASMSQ